MKRVISIALFLSVLFSMFSGLGMTVVSAAETDIAKTSAFNYTNPDMYVADCLVKGNIDNEGNATGEPLIYSALHHAYTYEYMAEALSDKEMVLGVSAMWNNVNNVMSGDFLEIAEMQKVFYEIVLMDYMTYISNTDEYKNNIYDSEAKNQYKIFSALVQNVSGAYPENVDDIIENMTISDAIDFSVNHELLKSLDDYTTLVDDISLYAESAADYIDKLSNVLTVQNINEDRIEFLKLVRQEGERHNDTDLVAAADEIISAYESGYAQIGLATVETMVDFGLKYAWKALGDANPFIKGLELGVAGLNWISNGEEASENNLKLMVLYIVNSYVFGAVRQLKSNYESNRTEDNARALNNGYLMYLNYQSYATESAQTFTNAMLYEGAWNKLKSLFSDENEKTYAQFSEYFKSDLNYNNGWSNIIGARYNMYYDIIGYSSEDYYEAVLKVDVTGVSFSKESIELGLDDVFQCLEKAAIQPENASNKTITYTSSDDSVLSVNKYNPLDITLHKAGQVTVTATTEDGNFTDSLIVNIVEGHGKDGVHLEDPAPQKSSAGKCGDNAYWTLYNNGLFRITGSGEMYDYHYVSESPWYDRRDKIKEIRILDGITSIAEHSFYECTSLESITIPDCVTSIGRGAFRGCTSLESITIPDGVTCIYADTFEDCSSLKSITIPDSVTRIGTWAFAKCTSLESITIPDSVTSIGWAAFCECTSLKSITIPDGVTSIGNGAFSYCSSLESIIIPDSVTSIGWAAFRECTSLKSITISDSLTSIDYNAFSYCSSLESIIIPDSVISIGSSAFYNCTSLKNITIPGSVTSIDSSVFYGCISLENVYISDIAAWCNTDFSNYYSNPLCYADNLYLNRELVKDVVIPQGVTNIPKYAFSCTSLESITIPYDVTSISDDAFSCCTSITIYCFENSCAETYANDNDIPFVIITEMPTLPNEPSKEIVEYVDEDTGIIVGTIPNVKLNVEKVEDEEETDRVALMLKNESVVDIFNITISDNGVVVQPNDTVKVKIPTDNELAKVYRVEDDGELTDMKAVYTDGYMVFNAEHISVYVLAIENTDVEDNPVEPTQPSTGGQDIPTDPTNSIEIGLLGDANGDGKVNIKDATLIQKSIANLTELTKTGEELADADLNTKINIKDATAIQKHIAGIETGFPIGEPLVSKENN